jgi:hypothetical protein
VSDVVVTVKVLPVPITALPHEPAYHLSVVPLPPFAVSVAGIPRHTVCEAGVIETGATGAGITMIVFAMHAEAKQVLVQRT